MNGKRVPILEYYVIQEDDENQIVKYTKLNGRVKEVYKDEVYSVESNEVDEVVFYEPGLEDGEILSQPQMKQFIIGLHDARYYQISPLYTLGGFTAGISGALVPQPELKLSDSEVSIPVGMLIPIGYAGIAGFISPSEEALKLKTENKNVNEYYLMGLREGTKKKVVRQSILGAGMGFVTGILILFSAK